MLLFLEIYVTIATLLSLMSCLKINCLCKESLLESLLIFCCFSFFSGRFCVFNIETKTLILPFLLDILLSLCNRKVGNKMNLLGFAFFY